MVPIKRKTLAAAVGLAAVSAGVGYAAIPSAGGTISACKSSKGALKVIDAEAGQSCPDGQQLLTWNQQGPAGPQGAPEVFSATRRSGTTGRSGVEA
jgi:hypothetical protein